MLSFSRVAGVLGYLPQDLIGQMSYEYYHPDDIQKMVHLHHDCKLRSHSHSPFLIPPFPIPPYSHEASDSHADGAVSVPEQVSEVGVVCHEGLFIRQSILTASGVCCLHQCHIEVCKYLSL